ncbi:hypothetical protein MIR68_002458 [Amoeboaphelidium protococcarum]|nr:hypothetical protein MIR68_002458 [Amoeboaphelidium protococcarum]
MDEVFEESVVLSGNNAKPKMHPHKLKRQLSVLNRHNEQVESRLHELSSLNKHLNEENARTKYKYAESQDNLDNLQTMYDQLDSDASTMRQRISSLEGQIKSNQDEYHIVASSADKLLEQIKDLTDKMSELESIVSDKDSSIHSLNRELQNKAEETRQKDQQLKKLEESLDGLKQTIEAKDQRLLQSESENARLQQENTLFIRYIRSLLTRIMESDGEVQNILNAVQK